MVQLFSARQRYPEVPIVEADRNQRQLSTLNELAVSEGPVAYFLALLAGALGMSKPLRAAAC